MADRKKKGSGMTPQSIEYLRTVKEMNQTQIARHFGVSRQAVSEMKRKYGRYSMTPRERVMEEFPWKVESRLQHNSPHKRMRDHAEYMATGGKGMSEDKLRRLAAFYDKLENENVVVVYDPSLPPSEGVSTGGWAFVPRKESDGELIIRVNEYATVSDEGRRLWTMPPRRPKV